MPTDVLDPATLRRKSEVAEPTHDPITLRRNPEKSRARRAVFLDRDGVLVRSYKIPDSATSRPPNLASELELLPGVAEAVKILQELDLLLVVISNQGGIGLGYMSEEEMSRMEARLPELLGVELDGQYHCSHKPREGCSCRKPNPGLFYRAAIDLEIDLARSYAVGDMVSDVDAAIRAGVKERYQVVSDMYQDAPGATKVFASLLDVAKHVEALEKFPRKDFGAASVEGLK